MHNLSPLIIFFVCLSLIGLTLLLGARKIPPVVNRFAIIVFRVPIILYPDIKKAVDVVFGDTIVRMFIYFCSLLFIFVGFLGLLATLVWYLSL